MKKGILILAGIFFLTSCPKDALPPTYKYIYKTKGDYFNLVCCILDDSKTHISTIFGAGHEINRFRLVQNYVFYQEGFKLKNRNVAFLSLTQDEYYLKFNQDTLIKYKDKPDTLDKYVAYKDPFIELYELKRCVKVDTAHFNNIIRKGELEKYYNRIK